MVLSQVGQAAFYLSQKVADPLYRTFRDLFGEERLQSRADDLRAAAPKPFGRLIQLLSQLSRQTHRELRFHPFTSNGIITQSSLESKQRMSDPTRYTEYGARNPV